jgi:hypothetical protein
MARAKDVPAEAAKLGSNCVASMVSFRLSVPVAKGRR